MLALFAGFTTCLLDKGSRDFRSDDYSLDFVTVIILEFKFPSPGPSGIDFFARTFESEGNSFLVFLLYEGLLMH